jgi:hypothetical protein
MFIVTATSTKFNCHREGEISDMNHQPRPLEPIKTGEVCSLQDAHAIPDCSSDPVGFQTDPYLHSGGLNYDAAVRRI